MRIQMQHNTKTRRKPNIRISQSDHERLSALARTVAARNPEASDELIAELERARVIADGWVSAGTVRMGSTVTFKPDTGDRKTVTLVYPGDADISEGKVSILTPIGTGLDWPLCWTVDHVDGPRRAPPRTAGAWCQPTRPRRRWCRPSRTGVSGDRGEPLDMGVSVRLLNHAGSLTAGV
jgi:transcription elongation GreA/GreB family factor